MTVLLNIPAVKFIFVLGWAIGFAVLNFGAKKLVVSLPSLADGGAIDLMKALLLSPWFPVLIFCYIFCALLYMMSLKLLPVSIAGPLFLVMGSLVAFVLGVVVFKDQVSGIKMAGMALSMVGIVITMWN